MILSDGEVRAMSALALAHMGDAVYEILARREVCRSGKLTAGELHRQTIRYVSAPAQARAADGGYDFLPVYSAVSQEIADADLAVYRRGRNAHSHAAPRAATEAEYHAASGLEALFGWLYLRGQNERIEELFAIILEKNNASGRHTADGAAP